MTESVPLQSAPMPLDMSPDVASYVGVLEGTVAALCINEAKYRAFLELLTGDPWEDTRIDFDGNALQALAASALVKQTGMDAGKAKVLVAQRWNNRNLPKEQTVPVAIPVQDFVSGDASNKTQESLRPDMSDRFRAWRDKQNADASEIGTSVPDLPTDGT